MMNLKKKLQNPMALIAQGFVAGSIFLYATTPTEVTPQPQAQSVPQQLAKISDA